MKYHKKRNLNVCTSMNILPRYKWQTNLSNYIMLVIILCQPHCLSCYTSKGSETGKLSKEATTTNQFDILAKHYESLAECFFVQKYEGMQ